MASSRVALTLDGPVAHVVLDRPEARNAFDAAMVRELHDAVGAASARDDVRVIVLAGRGSVFCAGADVEWMKTVGRLHARGEPGRRPARSSSSSRRSTARRRPWWPACRARRSAAGRASSRWPTSRWPRKSAQFGFTEVRLGLVPAVISPYVVRKIGVSAARELFLTGERFDAARAAAIGLVHRVVEAGRARRRGGRARAGAAAGRAGGGGGGEGPGAERATAARESVRELVCERIAERRASDEGQEGLQAFLEKRKPGWS